MCVDVVVHVTRVAAGASWSRRIGKARGEVVAVLIDPAGVRRLREPGAEAAHFFFLQNQLCRVRFKIS